MTIKKEIPPRSFRRFLQGRRYVSVCFFAQCNVVLDIKSNSITHNYSKNGIIFLFQSKNIPQMSCKIENSISLRDFISNPASFVVLWQKGERNYKKKRRRKAKRIDKSRDTFQTHGELKVAYSKVYKRRGHLDNPSRMPATSITWRTFSKMSLAANWLAPFIAVFLHRETPHEYKLYLNSGLEYLLFFSFFFFFLK